MNIEKLPAFIISQKTQTGRQFLTCTRAPFFVAEIFEFDNQVACLEFEANFNNGARTQHAGKYYTLIIRELVLNEKIQTQKQADKLARRYREAADFYLYNYLKT